MVLTPAKGQVPVLDSELFDEGERMTVTSETLGLSGTFLDEAMDQLRQGAVTLAQSSVEDRIGVLSELRDLLIDHAAEWVDVCCAFKSITTSAQRSEEILAGPSGVARYLTLLIASLQSIAQNGAPKIPGKIKTLSDGRLRVPVFPSQGVFDSVLFGGLHAEVWMKPGVTPETIHGQLLEPVLSPQSPAPIALVLGAGNVSAIPMTDSLTKLFHNGQVVLLKLNPVNDALKDVFCKILLPIIERGWMQIVCGGGEVGQAATHLEDVATVHITGSHHTHDRIVWGDTAEERQRRQLENDPLLKKPITSELGNVSPWVFMPGNYSNRQLNFQANNLAASLVNNAAFNCITTRVIVTWRQWEQREQFLDALDQSLAQVPGRTPYYPGTCDRFSRFTGVTPEAGADGQLPWLVMRDVDRQQMPQLFEDESFVSACAEVQLDAESPEDFLETATDFCNAELFGTLAAAVTIPNDFRRQQPEKVERALSQLNYGSVCVNQWPGLVYGLMTPPWGAAPDSDLTNIQSGSGNVHNLYFLDQYEKTVFFGPLCLVPKPIWFPSHTRAEQVAWKLLKLYRNPSVTGLPSLLASAVLG